MPFFLPKAEDFACFIAELKKPVDGYLIVKRQNIFSFFATLSLRALREPEFLSGFALKSCYVKTNFCDSGKFLGGSYGAVLRLIICATKRELLSELGACRLGLRY